MNPTLLSSFPPTPPVLTDLRSSLAIRRRLPLADWSESNIVLSPEYSNKTGPLHLFGWQRGIFDAFTDPNIQEIVVMSSTQIVKSLFLMCAIAYCIAEDPGPILLVEPKDDAAKQFSKRRLTALARDCKILHGKISESVHDGRNTLLSKDFPGGNLLIVSARTPTDLSQHTIRYLFCDEVDKYTADVGGSAEKGGEGDPLDLAWQRAMTFGSRRKRVIACSPTVAGTSRISRAFALSDQRRPWVPCPHCSVMQFLQFRNKEGYRVRWDSSLARELQPPTARYHCISCEKPWSEIQRWEAVNHHTEWRPDKPEMTQHGVAGFWVNHLYCPFTWKTVPELAKGFLNAKADRQALKVFVNTALAEEWQEEGETPDKDRLFARRETYPFNDAAIIPQRGLFLTAAVDLQDNPPRFEVEVVAWGRGRENWSIGYWIIQAFAENGELLPVTSPELRVQLDELLQRNWLHESGHTLPILVMCMDTGKTPKPVYEFARTHHQLQYNPAAGIKLHAIRTVVPVKGNDDDLCIISKVSKEDAARKRQGVRIISVGTLCAKTEIFDSLKHCQPRPNGSLSGLSSPGCYHFPLYLTTYFDGLTSEVRVVKSNGDVTYVKRGARNEPVDLKVYGRAGASIVGIDRFNEGHWRKLEEAVRPRDAAAAGVGPKVEGEGEVAGGMEVVTEEVVVDEEDEATSGLSPATSILQPPMTISTGADAISLYRSLTPSSPPPPPPLPVRPLPLRRIRGRFL